MPLSYQKDIDISNKLCKVNGNKNNVQSFLDKILGKSNK